MNCGFDDVADKVSLDAEAGRGGRGGGGGGGSAAVGVGVHCLHTCPVFEGVAVVYADGRVAAFQYTADSGLLPKKPEVHGNKPPPSPSSPAAAAAASSSVVWSSLLFDQKRGTARLVVLTTALNSSGSGGGSTLASFILFATDTGPKLVQETVQAVALPAPKQQQQQQQQASSMPGAVAACFQWPKTLYTFWPGGELVAHDLGRGGEQLAKASTSTLETLDGKLVVAVSALAVKAPSASKKRTKSADAETGVVLEAFNSTHILMAGADAKSKRPVALLWNTTYASLTARVHLDENESGAYHKQMHHKQMHLSTTHQHHTTAESAPHHSRVSTTPHQHTSTPASAAAQQQHSSSTATESATPAG